MNTTATLRTKATLEASLAAACDRDRTYKRAMGAIDLALRSSMGDKGLRDCIRRELDLVTALLGDIDAQDRRRQAEVSAGRYPDEDRD